MVHLLVPPPPPPPPQPPVKDVPPPPPPRRLKASILEDLPPPPPPPKRLKPSRSSAINVPVPFSQRLERTAASESNDGAANSADASAEKSSVEKSSSSSEEPQKDVPNEDEEQLDSSFPSSPEQDHSAEQDQYSPSSNMGLHIDDDVDEGEITEDSDSDIQSIADSDDDSECDDGVPDQNTFVRHDENGRLIKVVRHTRKRFDQINSIAPQPEDGVKKSLDDSTRNEADEEEVEMKPDREILDNPRHLLQRASAVLQGLGKAQGTQYTQMPYDDDYEEEECIQPMDSFHGEPVPDDDELFEVTLI
ncbi:hypothetical protein TELCIR_17567 [Teladorsagia circumcincta]|uniref:Uncharacterized protein n=1 Tax=Teladorsagia circumcincta TaxID=45464 RepID=A0A2G9TSE8_TELCI|nr:hypothetical protein TELCIR_17567 [Teladorsagia circumcincta]